LQNLDIPKLLTHLNLRSKADIFLVVGTSLQVYPAAGLINYCPTKIPKYVIDPNRPAGSFDSDIIFIEDKTSTGMETFMSLES